MTFVENKLCIYFDLIISIFIVFMFFVHPISFK